VWEVEKVEICHQVEHSSVSPNFSASFGLSGKVQVPAE
jgi:hypothetical protein